MVCKRKACIEASGGRELGGRWERSRLAEGGGGCVWTRLDESVDKGRMSDQARWEEDGGEGEECGTAGW